MVEFCNELQHSLIAQNLKNYYVFGIIWLVAWLLIIFIIILIINIFLASD